MTKAWQNGVKKAQALGVGAFDCTTWPIVNGKSTVAIDEKEAGIVRLIYQWYIEGDDTSHSDLLAKVGNLWHSNPYRGCMED